MRMEASEEDKEEAVEATEVILVEGEEAVGGSRNSPSDLIGRSHSSIYIVRL
jgi:hypothetical protein